MNHNTRAAIACIVSGSKKGQIAAVYDFKQSKHIIFSGSISNASVSIYDHDRGCHITGTIPGLYDHGIGGHIQLTINGNAFKGYDFHSGSHFSGTINGTNISIYDFQESTHFNYNA